MTIVAVERVAQAHRALARAMDNGAAHDIVAATEDLAHAMEQVRAAGAWNLTPELRRALTLALSEGEGARIRTRYLADYARRRLTRLQALSDVAPIGYGRDGRYRTA